jgi:cell division protein FtsZ
MEKDIIFNNGDNSIEDISLLNKDIITNFVPNMPKKHPCIIKVIGVGGGGGNAVTHMYKEGIQDVSFVLCNTDRQALDESSVPVKVQLGIKGLGAGNRPNVAKKAAEESVEDIKKMLSDGTEMVFITAGMGGGTGTGAGPVIANMAREMGILTIGIVTIPFIFEGIKKILQALDGVEEIKKNVDALLVINNERLLDIYSDLTLENAFKKADDTLTVAAKSIAEIITIPGIVNVDFADVNTTLRDGGVAIMSYGLGSGDNRLSQAINNALESPLLNNNDIFKAKKILLNIYSSKTNPIMTEEMSEVHRFMNKFGTEIEVIWGSAWDESLGDSVKITILATGFDIESLSSDPRILKEKEKLEKTSTAALVEQQRIEEEENMRLLNTYYPQDSVEKLTKGKIIYPKPFIFTLENIDDNKTIEALINHPAYNRSTSAMLEIAKKAKIQEEENYEKIN